MTDYEYIIRQLKKCHFTGWNDEVMRDCIDRLPNLSRKELTALTMSKWVKDYKVFKESIFNIVFAEEIGKREQRIKEMDTADLVEEFKDKKSGNVSLIRNEMQNRYKEGRDCDIIAEAFKASNEKDQQWVKKQLRKEEE